jgi:hypothetical protein
MRSKKQIRLLENCDRYMNRNTLLLPSIYQVRRWLNREFDKKVDRYNKEHEKK